MSYKTHFSKTVIFCLQNIKTECSNEEVTTTVTDTSPSTSIGNGKFLYKF